MPGAVVGALRVMLGMNAGEFETGTKKAGASMDRLSSQAKKLGAAIGAAFAVGQITSFAKDAVRAFGVQEKAVKAVEATLKTTGATAGFTSKQLQDMASALQEATTFGDEEILQKVTNNLLTFGNVVGPVFQRAQAAALDLSAVLGQDLQSSTIQLGKALNDPITGITALSRVGIAFTQQQKDQIKALVESGKVMEAQGVILQEIEKFYGDAAEAAARTTQGALTQASNAFGDAMEKIGEAIAPVVLPAARAVKTLAEAFQGLSPEMRTGIVVAGGVAVALAGVAATVGVLTTVLGAALAPIALTVGAIGTLAGAIAANWRGITNLATSIGEAFKGIYLSAKQWLVDALEPIVSRVQGFIDRIRNTFRSLREALGFEVIAEEITGNFASVTDAADSAVTRLSEIWNRGADEGEALAAEVAPKMAMPIIETAEKAKAAAKAVEDAKKKILREQEQLANQGLRLVENMRTPQEVLAEKAAALDMALAKNKISAEQFGAAMQRATFVSANAYTGMASDIAGTLSGVFGESKGFAIAQAIINTAEGVTRALATYPPPFNFAAAAAVGAAGAAQIATIRSTNKGGGGEGRASSVAPAAAQGPTQVPQAINLTLNGTRFSRDEVFGLIDQINNAGKDGKQIIVRPA